MTAKNRFKPSLKPTAVAILMALQLPVHAATEDVSEPHYPQADIGLGAGVVLGALIAGPIGAIAGSAAGSYIGHHVGTRQELADARAELVQARSRQSAPMTTVAVAEDARVLPANTIMHDVLHDILDRGFGVSVIFRTDADQLDPLYERQLRELAQVVAAVPGLKVELTGHADLRGAEQDNLALSERRIQSVAALLQQAGLEAGQISSQARGESDALASVEDADGQALDRRVIVRFFRASNLMEAAR